MCPTATSHSSMAAPTSMRLTAMVLQKLLTSVSLHGRVETPPEYYCFRLCNTSTNALFNHITYKNCLSAVFAETSFVFYAPPSHLDGLKQPRRRDLSNGPRTPHVAHELVKQSFLKWRSIFTWRCCFFSRPEQLSQSTVVSGAMLGKNRIFMLPFQISNVHGVIWRGAVLPVVGMSQHQRQTT